MDSHLSDLVQNAFISFRSKKMAMIFKMAWDECQKQRLQDFKVIMPILRRVMPSIIARDIIGVSPMTGPVSQIHSLRVRYAGNPPAPSPSTPIPKNDSED